MKKIENPLLRTLIIAAVLFLVVVGTMLLLAARARPADMTPDTAPLERALSYLMHFDEVQGYRVTDEHNAYIAFRYFSKDWEMILQSAAFVGHAETGRRVRIHFVTVKGLASAPEASSICIIVASDNGIEGGNCP